MRKTFILGIVILLLVGLLISACQNNENGSLASRTATENGKEVIVDDFSLTVTLDKTKARIGDTITATVVFKNLSGRDIEAELPDWIAARGGRSKDDILSAVFVPEGEKVSYPGVKFDGPLPKVLIESETVIERKFEHTITESKNLEARAGAYFFTDTAESLSGLQIAINPIKIKVQ